MTDEQIMQGLKWCYQVEGSCGDCPYRPDDIKKAKCHDRLGNDVIGLIERQQEEIDLLKMDNERMTTKVFEMAMKKVLKEKVRAEAIKEFADRVKQNLSFGKYIPSEEIDNLVKEMGCGE